MISDLDWWCTNFTCCSLTLKLNFTDQMETSQDHQDQPLMIFKETDQFVLSAHDEFLFRNYSTDTISYTIPTQMIDAFRSSRYYFKIDIEDGSASECNGHRDQFDGIIRCQENPHLCFVYYCALQKVILLVKHSDLTPPVSVKEVIDQICGIINRSSLDRRISPKNFISRQSRQRRLLKSRRCGSNCHWYTARNCSGNFTQMSVGTRIDNENQGLYILEFLDQILPSPLHRIQICCTVNCAEKGRQALRHWFCCNDFGDSVRCRVSSQLE